MKAKRMKQKVSKSKIKNKRNIKINKVILLFIVLVAIVGAVVFFIYKNSNKVEDLLLGEKDVFGMELKNISIEKQNGIYIFTAQLKNTLNEKFESKPVQIIFRDEKNQKIIKYKYTINDLEKGEIQDIKIKTSEPIDEFYTFYIEED